MPLLYKFNILCSKVKQKAQPSISKVNTCDVSG